MTITINAMPSIGGVQAAITRAGERIVVQVLVACGVVLIVVPLALTIYLSLFDEKLILFPPRGYTLGWYSAIWPNFGDAITTSLELGAAAVVGSLLLGVPAGIGLSRHRFRGRSIISTLLLAPLTVPGHRSWAFGLCRLDSDRREPRHGSNRLDDRPRIGPYHDHHALGRAALPRQPDQSRTRRRGSCRQSGSQPADGNLARHPAGNAIGHHRLGAVRLYLLVREPGIGSVPDQPRRHHPAGRRAAVSGYHIDPLVSAVAVAQIAAVAVLLLMLDRFIRLGQVVR